MKTYCIIYGLPVATLSDLALCKGIAWIGNRRSKDLSGLKYVVLMMAHKGVNFRGLGMHEKELLSEIMEGLPEL